jgi:prepilin-type N-terminal cleavage/methylation domain-containing protein/prepilin-type processing-associated H-X9-DG protein
MRPAGFTLVEVIVVVSIMAVSMSILSPVLSITREHARTAFCASKIDNIVLSLQTYDAENGSLPRGYHMAPFDEPPPGLYIGDARIDLVGWYWFHYAGLIRHRSMSERRLLQCPSKRLDDGIARRSTMRGNFGVNLSLCKMDNPLRPYNVEEFQGAPLSASAIRRPSEVLLAADSGYSLISWWHAAEEAPITLKDLGLDSSYVPGLEINNERTLLAGTAIDAVGGRHYGKTVNVGFVDGHVSPMKAKALLVEKTGENEWGNSLLWRPK